MDYSRIYDIVMGVCLLTIMLIGVYEGLEYIDSAWAFLIIISAYIAGSAGILYLIGKALA